MTRMLVYLYRLYLHGLTGAMIAVPFLFGYYIEQQYLLLGLNVVLILAFHIIVVHGYTWIHDTGINAIERRRRSLLITGPAMAMIFALAASNPGAAGMMLGAGLIMGSISRSFTLAIIAVATLFITMSLMLTSANYEAPLSMLIMLPLFMLLGMSDQGYLHALIVSGQNQHVADGDISNHSALKHR